MAIDGLPSSPPTNMSPDAYAQKVATENGISLEEAKNELKARYGEPKKPGMTENGSVDVTYNRSTSTDSTTSLTNSLASTLASLDSTDDTTTTQSSDYDSLDPKQKELVDYYNIPIDIVKQGDDAIRLYAEENDITLPQREEP